MIRNAEISNTLERIRYQFLSLTYNCGLAFSLLKLSKSDVKVRTANRLTFDCSFVHRVANIAPTVGKFVSNCKQHHLSH